jgi:CheY-like chemotaxis protein
MEETKILIVDDDPGIAHIIQVMLEGEGYTVEVAKDGNEGYSLFLLFHPDLVLTDIQMPLKNGIELMMSIRLQNPAVKTIYMSGDLRRFQRLLEEESKRYQIRLLSKPFSKGELMKSLLELSLG